MLGEHFVKMLTGLLVYGKGIGHDLGLAGLFDGLLDIMHAVIALVAVIIAWSAIGDQNNDLALGLAEGMDQVYRWYREQAAAQAQQ